MDPVTGLAMVAGAVCAAGAVVAAPVVLGAAGFTSDGIAAGSYAAGMMSSAAIANGGGVAAGSLVAVLQSAGVAGLSGTAMSAVAAVGGGLGFLAQSAGAVGAATAATAATASTVMTGVAAGVAAFGATARCLGGRHSKFHPMRKRRAVPWRALESYCPAPRTHSLRSDKFYRMRNHRTTSQGQRPHTAKWMHCAAQRRWQPSRSTYAPIEVNEVAGRARPEPARPEPARGLRQAYTRRHPAVRPPENFGPGWGGQPDGEMAPRWRPARLGCEELQYYKMYHNKKDY